MQAYNAFAQPGPVGDRSAGSVSYSTGIRVAPAAPPGQGILSLTDEDALQWLQRDSADPRLAKLIGQKHEALLWDLLPCFDSEADGVSTASMMHNSAVRVGGHAHGAFVDDASHAAGGASSLPKTTLNVGQLLEIYAAGGAGKTEMMYQAIAATLLPKVNLTSSAAHECSKQW